MTQLQMSVVKPSSTPSDDGCQNCDNGFLRPPSGGLTGPGSFVKSDEWRQAWPDIATCATQTTVLSCLAQQGSRAKEEFNKATLQAHCSSPCVSRETSLRAEHNLRPPAALWTGLLSFMTTARWADHMRPPRPASVASKED